MSPFRLQGSARQLLAKAEAAIGADRTTNTPRRARMAQTIVQRAERDALRARVALALVAQSCRCGPALVDSMASIEGLEDELFRTDASGTRSEVERAMIARFPTQHPEIVGKLAKMGVRTEAQLRATLIELATLRANVERTSEDRVRVLERGLVAFKAPGYFPTPKPLAVRLAELAEIEHGDRVLEPSAGSGRLADAARERGGRVTCVEIHPTLVELLRAKGHDVHHADFAGWNEGQTFDRVVMNPPFEKGADVEHVKRAYELLRPGGILIAITGERPWFGGDRVSTAFRAWIDERNVFHNERLPSGTFDAKDVTQRTGVAARLLGIRKRETS